MCYVMKTPFSSCSVLCLLLPFHVQCDHSVWLWVINNLSERKIQRGHRVNLNHCPFPGTAVWLSLYDSGKNSLATSVPPQTPPLFHAWAHWLEVSALGKPGYKCFVIDIRSCCFLKYVSLDFPLQRLRGICAGANSVLQPTTIRTVLELCETVGREGLCSFNGRLNECVCCIAFTALFTFLDHMEILLHYILTKSSVWLGGRERRWESEPVLD